MYPPDTLIQDCNVPYKDIITNEDLVIWSKDLYDSLKECNVDKESLRKWKQEWMKKENKDV